MHRHTKLYQFNYIINNVMDKYFKAYKIRIVKGFFFLTYNNWQMISLDYKTGRLTNKLLLETKSYRICKAIFNKTLYGNKNWKKQIRRYIASGKNYVKIDEI